MRNTVMLLCGIFLTVSCTSPTVSERQGAVIPALKEQVPECGGIPFGPSLPDGFVLADLTLAEAVDSFYKWYRTAYPPQEQTISCVIESVSPGYEDKKRTVDLSGARPEQAIPKIAKAFGLSAQYFNGMFHIRNPKAATRGIAVDAEEKLPETNYLSGFLASNVIAAVVGYETSRHLTKDVSVPVFSIDASSQEQPVNGVLFKILAPSRYADKFFWTAANAGADEQDSPENLYNINLLYSFRLGTGSGQFGAISENEFFTIPPHNYFSTTTWAGGTPFYKGSKDVAVACKAVDQHLLALSNEITQAASQLKSMETGTEEYAIEKAVYESVIEDAENARKKRWRLLESAARINENQEFLNLLYR